MNINTVALTGNLTRDPELKTFGDTTVCKMRLAVNERAKEGGEWVNKPMYFDVDVFGRMADNCATYLKRGSRVAISGRLKWREWESENGKRQAVSIVANEVEFPTKKEAQGDAFEQAKEFTRQAQPPAQDFREQQRTATDETFAGDDDIPF